MQYLNSLFSPLSSSTLSSSSSSPMKVYLDIIMFILIAIASYTLIFAQSSLEYKQFMIIIMFGYLLYFLKYRLADYFVRNSRLSLHSISELQSTSIQKLPSINSNINNNNNMNNKYNTNQSVFLQQYTRRQNQKASKQQIVSDIDQKQSSFASYMNRSRRANDTQQQLLLLSRSKNNISNASVCRDQRSGDLSSSDFGFLSKNSIKDGKSGKLLRQSFISKFKGMNDTFIRNIQHSHTQKQQLNKELQSKLSQINKNYNDTVHKQMQVTLQQAYRWQQNIKLYSIDVVADVYSSNVENIGKIVQTVQDIYYVKIGMGAYVSMLNVQNDYNNNSYNNINSNNSSGNDYTVEMSVGQLLTTFMRSKQGILKLPIRTLKPQQSQSHLLQTLSKLHNTRLTLNSTLHLHSSILQTLSSATLSLGQQILQTLSILQQYQSEIDRQQWQSQYTYQLNNGLKIQQHVSQQMTVVFQVVRNRINQIVNYDQYCLMYQTNCFMGWVRIGNGKNTRKYQLVQNMNNDFGHPHYNLLVTCNNNNSNSNSIIKSGQYCTQYGINNGYSILMMYLWVFYQSCLNNNINNNYNSNNNNNNNIINGESDILNNNSKLKDVISRCLEIVII